MYLGKIVELADTKTLFANPQHPYTKALLSAVPVADPRQERNRKDRMILKGELPSPLNPPVGCNFNTRCPLADEHCQLAEPELLEKKPGHQVSCFKI